MLKLYKITGTEKSYWETWDNDDGTHFVHWGALGTEGESKKYESTPSIAAESIIQEEVNDRVAEGFLPIEEDDHSNLVIEFKVEGHGNDSDREKLSRGVEKLNEVLGWSGLGHCDGGSIGSGTMELFNFVVDFELAKSIVARELVGTEFENYHRFYDGREEL